MLINFEAKPELVSELERVYRITDEILKSFENDGKGPYSLSKGDNVIVTVNNTNTTLAQLLRNFVYKVTGSDTYQIGASASALVVSNGK